jgi:outer membrane murein-binding lipoprotein Lpp
MEWKPMQLAGRENLIDVDKLLRVVQDLNRRVERLEEEMDTARALIAQQIKFNLERPTA